MNAKMYYTEALPGYVAALASAENMAYITSYYAEWHKIVGELQSNYERRNAEPLVCEQECECPDCNLDHAPLGGGASAAPILLEYVPSGTFEGLQPDNTLFSHAVLALYRDGVMAWTWIDARLRTALVEQGFASADGVLTISAVWAAESMERHMPQMVNDGFWHNGDDGDSDLERRD